MFTHTTKKVTWELITKHYYGNKVSIWTKISSAKKWRTTSQHTLFPGLGEPMCHNLVLKRFAHATRASNVDSRETKIFQQAYEWVESAIGTSIFPYST
jgi:hypothetical protein